MEYNILGKSNSAVSIILENLYSIHDKNYTVNIIKNMEDTTDLPYKTPGIITNEFTYDKYVFNTTENNYIIGAMRVSAKQSIYNFFEKHGITLSNYKTIIPKHAIVSQTCEIGNGTMLNYGTVLAPYVKIGYLVTINRNCSIGHHTKIGNFTTINPGVNIAGNCHIGDNVTIGIGCTIVDGINIGDNSVIGAGTLILKDVPSNVIIYGNPAKIVRNIT